MNKKGFTLVELLAVIIIIGIISGIAIGGTSIYMNKTREKAYEAMELTLFNGAQNYIIDNPPTNNISVSSEDIDTIKILHNGMIYIIRNGQMYILRDGVMYNAIGQIAE